MRSGLRRAGTGAQHDSWVPACAALSTVVRAIAVVAVAVSGCAPMDHDTDTAMFGAAAAGPRSPSRSRPHVPLPSARLLRPQVPPDCGDDATADAPTAARDAKRVNSTAVVEQASAAKLQPSPVAEQADPNAELALRIKLEYERECYRRAEAHVRERLHRLQGSISETVKSVNSIEARGR